MIVSFSLENWMSFRDQVDFSMVASRERQHGDRVPKHDKYRTRILPIAALYGGNASGKTNFFKALSFAKNLVTKSRRPDSLIPVEPFLLDADGTTRPSRFIFELLIDETIYEFSFAVTRKGVLEEKLVIVNSASEKVLYDRHDGGPNFSDSLANDQFLQFAFRGTQENQLFLTNSVSQGIDRFRPVYDWFDKTLQLIAPDSRFELFHLLFNTGHPINAVVNEALSQFDTGIVRLSDEEIPFDSISMPESLRVELQEKIKDGVRAQLLGMSTHDRTVVFRKDGELIAKKLVTYHPKSDGTEVRFDIRQESDGTRRMIDLLPAFFDLLQAFPDQSGQEAGKVYVIDEIDRSLHTLLVRSLIEAYLEKCSIKTRSQMLLTTHDVLLMDQHLLRRDEMWVTERDDFGTSSLFPFSDYKEIRYDKDIRKSYLQGRLGGIPRILPGGALTYPGSSEENTRTD